MNERTRKMQSTHDLGVHLRRAFTMMEVLMAMVIVGFLVALLVPAAAAVRRSMQMVDCSNRQRLVYQGTMQFAQDNKGHLPHIASALGGPYMYNQIASYFDNGKVIEKLLHCPSEPNHYAYGPRGDYGPNGYFINMTVLPTGLGRSLMEVITRDSTFMMADARSLGVGFWQIDVGKLKALGTIKSLSDTTAQVWPPRHGNSMNYVFFDGRVESITTARIDGMTTVERSVLVGY